MNSNIFSVPKNKEFLTMMQQAQSFSINNEVKHTQQQLLIGVIPCKRVVVIMQPIAARGGCTRELRDG